MKWSNSVAVSAVVALAVSGCASAQGASGQPATPAHAGAEKPGCPIPGGHDHPPPDATAQPSQAFVLPKEVGPGAPQEKKVLVDNPFVKLVLITLRGGAEMAEHAAPMPITIKAVSGGGVVRLGAREMRLDQEHMVALAPGVPHAVVPDAGTDLVILLHGLKPGAKK